MVLAYNVFVLCEIKKQCNKFTIMMLCYAISNKQKRY